MNIAINGFGRIARNFLRALLQNTQAHKKLNVVAINLIAANPHFIAHSFRYDTLLGVYPGFVELDGDTLIIDGMRIKVLTEPDTSRLPWRSLGIEWVLETGGGCMQRSEIVKHCKAGARGVVIAAPVQEADITVILGVNDGNFDAKKHTIVSVGSCTTNAVIPVLKVLNDTFGIESAYMTTVHAYTNAQSLLDVDRTDARRDRAAALNIIPTVTGAMKVVNQILPELAGRVEGCSLRVPVAKVSLIDLAFVGRQVLNKDAINHVLYAAQNGPMAGILAVTDQPLVSIDFSENDNSVIIDSLLTQVTGPLGKVFGWYDNEWAYSCRLRDFLVHCV